MTEAKTTETGTLEVKKTKSALEWFDDSGRTRILDRLRSFICEADNAVFGFDFPFGFPESTVDADSWRGFLEEFAETFEGKNVNDFPGGFGEEGRPKREDDHRYGGQSPMSPLIKYQVFYGLRDVLWPLIEKNAISVLPMQSRRGDKPVLLEVYPAGTFGRLGLYRTGYKGSGEAEKRRRKENVHDFQSLDEITIPESSMEAAIESDDALDSSCAVVSVWRALENGLEIECSRPVEGHIYV